MAGPRYDSAADVERAFYEAFERADLEAMMGAWAPDDGLLCIHPSGAVMRGRAAVEQSWREIFASRISMRFEVTCGTVIENGTLAIHNVVEEIRAGPRMRQVSRVIATNVYRLADDGWRMVAHHASPGAEVETDPPAPPPKTLH